MRIVGVFLLAAILPLGGCAGIGAVGDAPPEIGGLPRNYIVFFAFNSAALDDTAQGVIAQAADDALQFQPAVIEIAGFSGEGPNARTGPQIANQRFTAVEEALAASGLDRALFERVDLMDEANHSDVAVRRVEIRLENS
jgi:outer membrane protein OmpA-like peptidoglycan-associated protein